MINIKTEKNKIISFIKTTFQAQGISKAIIGVSGGIDSAVSLYLLIEALGKENVTAVHLYYFEKYINHFDFVVNNLQIIQKNKRLISIKKPVDEFKKLLKINENNPQDKIQLGNIMARTRMIVLFDLAKKNRALVCGTENKSERLLGYFTRFGDAASDIEPITHLYKTQVYQLAKYLAIPNEIINQKPTAGLWKGQTDEAEFDFSYEEADLVLYLYYDKKISLKEIIKKGLKNAEKIISFSKKNLFKQQTPYKLF